jgi:hypothetical protein
MSSISIAPRLFRARAAIANMVLAQTAERKQTLCAVRPCINLYFMVEIILNLLDYLELDI